jgi:DNA-binding NarL/FixJ family response regulator
MEDALLSLWPEVPDVVLVDIGLPGMSGLDGLRLLRERYPDSALLMLTVYEDDERIFDALCAGACGDLLKRTPPAKLLESLQEAKLGGAPMSPEVARRVISLFRTIRPPQHAGYDLTPHEVRLLKLLAEGHNYRICCRRAGRELPHCCVSCPEYLREAAGALEIGSRRQDFASPPDLLRHFQTAGASGRNLGLMHRRM